MSWNAHSSYSPMATLRNCCSARAFDRLLGEAFSRQVANRLRARASACNDSRGAERLRLECRHTPFDELAGDSATHEVVSDESIARAPLRQQLRAPPREALVVDRPGF